MNQRYDDFMGGTIPDYTQHEAERREAAARTREAKVHLMNPTIHVQLQVRSIVASDYQGARRQAYEILADTPEILSVLQEILYQDSYQGVPMVDKFITMARVAKEVDGTYTVTLP